MPTSKRDRYGSGKSGALIPSFLLKSWSPPQPHAPGPAANVERRLRDVLRMAGIGYWELDLADHRLILSDEIFDIFEIAPAQAGGSYEAFVACVHQADLPRVERARAVAMASRRPYEIAYRVPLPDGSLKCVREHGDTVNDADGKPLRLVGTVQDATLAYHDPLTGLPNRHMLFDRLIQALSQARRFRRPLAVLFVGLDRFTRINEMHGHDVGDELLKVVAARLATGVRSGDTVARLEGDRFVLVLTEIADPRDAARVADKVVAALNDPASIADRMLRVTASVGIAVHSANGADDGLDILKKAGQAMCAAKAAGRNGHVIYDASLAPPSSSDGGLS